MSASEYAVRFNGLSRHAPALVTIVRERVRRFIEGLNKSIRYNMARELESDTPYQQVVEIAQRLEEWRGALDYVPSSVISFLKAQRIVEKVCNAYLAFVRDVSADTRTIESVPIVRDIPDIFPVDLPGMPPYMDIDFGIDLLSVTQSITWTQQS
ncbi:uncharacterized protein [Nicotiana tomentosiformis]|uniref:uncharacterized protein n=1 Tax=Nicotiana tomentosiformis TaxID=4098 RepID=UPI00388CCEA1